MNNVVNHPLKEQALDEWYAKHKPEFTREVRARQKVIKDDSKAVDCWGCGVRYDFGNPFACFSCYPAWHAKMNKYIGVANDVIEKIEEKEEGFNSMLDIPNGILLTSQ